MLFIRTAVALFLVAVLAGCGSGYSSSPTSPASPSTPSTTTPSTTTPSTASAVTVAIPNGARSLGAGGFAPNPLTVAVGTTVTWSNTDTASASHDVVADNGAFDSGQFGNGRTFTFTFPTKGTFQYHCSIHPGMVGTVVVQ